MRLLLFANELFPLKHQPSFDVAKSHFFYAAEIIYKLELMRLIGFLVLNQSIKITIHLHDSIVIRYTI